MPNITFTNEFAQNIGDFRPNEFALDGHYARQLSDRIAVAISLRFIYSNLAPGQVVGTQETKAGISTAFDVAGLYRSNKFGLGSMKGQLALGFNLANMGPKIQYSDSDQRTEGTQIIRQDCVDGLQHGCPLRP